MGWAGHVACSWEGEKCVRGPGGENLAEGDGLEDLGIDVIVL
jgi:hypothetical protein